MVSSNPGDDRAWRSLEVIFYALLLGQFIFGLVVLFLINGNQAPMLDTLFGPGQDELLLGLYALAMVAGGLFLDQFRTRNIPRAVVGDRATALPHYRVSVILRMAVLEAGVFMLLVTALLTGNLNLLAIAAALMGVFYLKFRPTREQFRQRYNIR